MVQLRYKRSKFRFVALFGVAAVLTWVYLVKRYSLKEHLKVKENFEKKAEDFRSTTPFHLMENVDLFRPKRVYTVPEMKIEASKLNFIQKFRNSEQFGNHTSDSPVIVIQIHDRVNSLKFVLQSLQAVEGIENASMVISRDKFSEEMDDLIDRYISFCRYLEIYFPFSMQLYPDKFPGEDPNDCPRDLWKEQAISRGCNNADFPDMYGHYREVKFVQIKHHWFWKLNMVFNGIRVFQRQTAPILFIEDDHYVAPDILHMMRKSVDLKKQCDDCDMVTLGSYEGETDYNSYGEQFNMAPWESSKHNMGMVLDREFFDKLTANTAQFCTYDDYNWDWTLQYVGSNTFENGIHTLVAKVPHVFHMGCLGFHKSSGSCVVDTMYEKYKNLMQQKSSNLFPEKVRILSTNKSKKQPGNPNGGWGDIRDHSLCKSYGKLCSHLAT